MVEGPAYSRDRPSADEHGFRDWMAQRMTPLRRKAFLLCGDWHRADDLVQDTLVTMYAGWSRIARGSNVDAYANRVLVHKHLDERRRPWRRERPMEVLPDSVDERARRELGAVDDLDDQLASALAALPAAQRVVLVLRYTDDLTLEEIARALDVAVGTVKSRLSRGSDAVRADLARHGHPRALRATVPASPDNDQGAPS